MKKSIRMKLLKMDHEKLIEIIDLLCYDKVAERKLSLLVNTSPINIERALSEFDGYCSRYKDSSGSESILKRLLAVADSLFAVAKETDTVIAAQIFYGLINAYHTNDLYELYDDTINDYLFSAVDELAYLLKNEEQLFALDTAKKYKQVVDYYSG